MQLTIQMPDMYFVNYEKQNIAKQIKLYTALMMFSSGQVSAGAACEIAEIDRYTFNEKCKEYNISVINYNINEVQDELRKIQNSSK